MNTNALKSRFRAKARGAASVEAVVVLPIFLVLFISVFFVRDQVLTKQAAQERARTCAWLYSANNCEFDARLMPAECRGVVSEAPIASDAAKAITEKLAGDGFFNDIVSKMIDSALDDVFGRAIDVKVQRDVKRPGLYGGGSQAMTAEYHLACNLKPRTKLDIAKDAWSRVSPFN
jgi:hypothetical protein